MAISEGYKKCGKNGHKSVIRDIGINPLKIAKMVTVRNPLKIAKMVTIAQVLLTQNASRIFIRSGKSTYRNKNTRVVKPVLLCVGPYIIFITRVT